MHIDLTLNFVWWQWLLVLLVIIYVCGMVIFAVKGAGLKLSLIWPLFLIAVALGANVQ